MKRFLFNMFFVLLAFVSSAGMFILKYQVIDQEEKLAALQHNILRNQRTIHVLKAEWSHLNDPERIRALIEAHTTLAVVKPAQIIRLEDVAMKELPAPTRKPQIVPVAYERP